MAVKRNWQTKTVLVINAFVTLYPLPPTFSIILYSESKIGEGGEGRGGEGREGRGGEGGEGRGGREGEGREGRRCVGKIMRVFKHFWRGGHCSLL